MREKEGGSEIAATATQSQLLYFVRVHSTIWHIRNTVFMHNMSASIINEKELTMNEISFNLFKTQKQIHIYHSLSDDFVRFGYSITNVRTSNIQTKSIYICIYLLFEH